MTFVAGYYSFWTSSVDFLVTCAFLYDASTLVSIYDFMWRLFLSSS